ncbi:MAG: UDP-3-O-(3-hydroxymyristoyl)glucosamine N-acyltransferase [Alphaproteobacteria bacterium]|nr:UDP-3-O-(3-hydroxymyristoyl)glucosamine N-acyltransferase [Alphaproteobacteria bacterium]
MGADSRFYASAGSLTLGVLRTTIGLAAAEDDARHFGGVAPLGLAGPHDVAFMEGRKNLPALKATKAGAVVIEEAFAEHVPAGSVPLVVASPQAEFIKIARLYHPPVQPKPGIHPSAVIAPDAVIGAGCEIGALVYVGANAEIGAHSILEHHCSIGDGCKLGAHGRIHAHASMAYCIAGERVVLHPGARIGNEGFGFITTPQGQHVTMPQLGRVIIGDGAEIGAGTCIDRGAGGDTVIGTGSRIDNLVQIGHNVTIGHGAVIVGQAGIAGSSSIGDHAVLAGQAGIAGHVSIGAKARVGAQAGVLNDVPPGIDVLGSPAWPAKETMRAFARLRRLASSKTNEKTG